MRGPQVHSDADHAASGADAELVDGGQEVTDSRRCATDRHERINASSTPDRSRICSANDGSWSRMENHRECYKV